MIGTEVEVEVVRGVECVRAVLEDANVLRLARDLKKKSLHPCTFCPVFTYHHKPHWNQGPECKGCKARGGVYVIDSLSPLLRMRSNHQP